MSSTTSRLGAALAQPAQRPGATAFAEALAGKPPLTRVPFTVNGVELVGWVCVLGTEVEIEIEASVHRVMRGHELEQGILNSDYWDRARIARTLARCVREADDVTAAALGTVEMWGKVPMAAQNALIRVYLDMREEDDPALQFIEAADLRDLFEAAEKKSSPLLRRFGAQKLAAFALILAGRLESLLTEKSSPGDSSPAT